MPTYNPGIPTGTVPLNLDYQNIQNNFTQLNTLYNTDHVPLTDTTALKGYHQTIHSVPFSTTSSNPPNNQPVAKPTSVAGVSEIFTAIITDGINTASALYFQTDTGLLMQLTRNFVPVAAATGKTFLPGGLILQWGTVAATNSSPTVTFPLAFPANCFNVSITRMHSSSSPGSNSYWLEFSSPLSKTSFKIINDDGHTWSYLWTAIGN